MLALVGGGGADVSPSADRPQSARLKILPTATLPFCLWSQRIFPALPGSRLTIFYRDAFSALLELNQWLNFTYSRSHAFRYGRKNTSSADKNRSYDSRTSGHVRLPLKTVLW